MVQCKQLGADFVAVQVTRLLSFILIGALSGQAADNIASTTTHAKAYGPTKNAVAIDPAKDLPRYPAVPPDKAIATWKVKPGFHLELAAHEPQVRSPIAISFDERGRMFVCEMIDYSELRDVTPHLGRISVLEDRDHDGYCEHSQVFADDLAWPTGLIWANGGLYVIATPDILFFKDLDGDGKAEVREVAFTGFGTGLKLLNVQGLANCPQWGQDNRIHVLAGGGNRGVITSPKRPSQAGIELGGKDFWFDPRTYEFGLEGGGAQYGMSFDNYGRKFACSNSDHLQYWVYDDRYANRNPYFAMPPARQSIAADGGACEVFRISPDEPWRIIRTRWRVAGVVKGMVEGGGRVSGYFTGATGTTIYRGDQYGEAFLNNSFTGDAGGQLVHRKIISPSKDGISLVGKRPADEQGYEFAASTDTWVRVVNFANAPDGCLHIIDMHREIIEHPWSIPDEIKAHLDLNSGSDMGRIFRLVKDGAPRTGQSIDLASASTAELVEALSHTNGWHRDTAQRLLYERQDKSALPLLEKVLAGGNALATLHALGTLQGLGALTDDHLAAALRPAAPSVNERVLQLLSERLLGRPSDSLIAALAKANLSTNRRTAFQVALMMRDLLPYLERSDASAAGELADNFFAECIWKQYDAAAIRSAHLASHAETAVLTLPFLIATQAEFPNAPTHIEQLIELTAVAIASRDKVPLPSVRAQDFSLESFIDYLVANPRYVRPFAAGLRRAGSTLSAIDTEQKLTPVFTKAAATAQDTAVPIPERVAAIDILSLAEPADRTNLSDVLFTDPSAEIQLAAIRAFGPSLAHFANHAPLVKAAAITALLVRDATATALLNHPAFKPADLTASQVQALIHHKNAKLATLAKDKLVSVIPLSRSAVLAKFQQCIFAPGDKTRGQSQYLARCMACHRAGGLGLQVGPDLVTVKTKGREALLTAILDPHKEVAAQFIAYTVSTKDNQTVVGIITDDNATSLTLTMIGGVTRTIPRSEIKGSTSNGQSLMPEGLETGMTADDMADLLAFIEGL